MGAGYGSCWNSYSGCSLGFYLAFNISVAYFVINLLSQSPISMQVVVEKKLNTQNLSRHDLGRERFVDKVSSLIYSHLCSFGNLQHSLTSACSFMLFYLLNVVIGLGMEE